LQSYVTKDSLQALHAWFHSVRTRSWTRTLPSARCSAHATSNKQQATTKENGTVTRATVLIAQSIECMH